MPMRINPPPGVRMLDVSHDVAKAALYRGVNLVSQGQWEEAGEVMTGLGCTSAAVDAGAAP